MTQLTPEQEAALRAWVGDDLSNSYLEGLYDGMIEQSWDQVVIMALRRKIAVAAEQPYSLTVPGLSISWGHRWQALNQMLKDFFSSGGTGLDEGSTMGFKIVHLVRPIRR